jgi:type I restriction enzyme, S subunit
LQELPIATLRSFIVALPPLPEQRSIAQALSDVDALIAALDKLIAKKCHLKTATMQQLLTGKMRSPGFGEGKDYKQTEIGIVPEDWEITVLENLGAGTLPSIKAGPFGSSLTKDTYVSEGYKVYGQEQVIRGDYLYGDYFISSEKFRQLESCSVRANDILLSLVGTAGKVLVIPEGAPSGIINPRLLRLSFDKDLVNPNFFKALFDSGEIQGFLTRYAQGGTMGVLNAGMLRAVSIALPSLEEQRSIAQVLSDMDAEITALETRRAKTQAIKQGMMQELLTGRTRLI